MKLLAHFLVTLALSATTALATPLTSVVNSGVDTRHPHRPHHPRQGCKNGPTSRHCWGEHSIDTNWYETAPNTGVTREYWLSVQEGVCNQDGFKRSCQTFNGTFPGPLIWANWGDNLIVHVTNNLKDNGTAVHWHGLHQRGSVEYDGVPGVTQCPIAPGETLAYKFRAEQYGTTWYHSHFSLQYADGLLGPMIFYGPATANYDEDLGTLMLQDWTHSTAWEGWDRSASRGPPPVPENGLINGTNTFDCSTSPSSSCVGGGKKFSTTFVKGKKHLIRVINTSNDAHFEFSIDGHNLTVIANDLVPIKPYNTTSVRVAIGQRYDVIVHANAEPGNYWLRSGMYCTPGTVQDQINMRNSVTGIIRYDPKSTEDPKSQSHQLSTSCSDEPANKLVPHLSLNVTNPVHSALQVLSFNGTGGPWAQWTLNTSSLVLDWHDPTLELVFDNRTVFPTPYNVLKAERTPATGKQWFTLIIQSNAIPLDHPIHLHGHDFWVLEQSSDAWNGSTRGFDFTNPPRRDTATLPSRGHLALAFELDNPGAWLVHCHIAWHASQGLSLEFVESQSQIALGMPDHQVFRDTCAAWDKWRKNMPFPQHDSGI